ncbi:MAG: methyltransferase domain-containing protein [candidate division Zixibacteria bacterium]|nr:methyltransferase domain-containing protein [candidate division Zixibacteria bacterium]
MHLRDDDIGCSTGPKRWSTPYIRFVWPRCPFSSKLIRTQGGRRGFVTEAITDTQDINTQAAAYCPVCETEVHGTVVLSYDSEVFGKRYDLLRCPECGTGICVPQLTDDDLETYYTEEEVVGAGLYEKWLKKYRYIHDWIVPFTGGRGRAAELGCNSANQLRYFHERGWDVLGFEFSKECQEYAKRVNDVEVTGTMLAQFNAEHPEQTFDLFLLIHTFEHITNPAALLADLKQALASDGLLYIEVPNVDSWSYDWLGEFDNVARLPFHSYIYTQQSLRQLLQRCGYEVVAERPYSMKEDGGLLTRSLEQSLRFRLQRRLGRNIVSRAIGTVLKWIIRFYPNRLLITKLAGQRGKSASFAILARPLPP